MVEESGSWRKAELLKRQADGMLLCGFGTEVWATVWLSQGAACKSLSVHHLHRWYLRRLWIVGWTRVLHWCCRQVCFLIYYKLENSTLISLSQLKVQPSSWRVLDRVNVSWHGLTVFFFFFFFNWGTHLGLVSRTWTESQEQSCMDLYYGAGLWPMESYEAHLYPMGLKSCLRQSWGKSRA